MSGERRGFPHARVATAVLVAGACAIGGAYWAGTQEPVRSDNRLGAAPATPGGGVRLVAYQTCDEVLGDLRRAALERVGPFGLDGMTTMIRDAVPTAGSLPAEAGRAADDQAPAHSTTNNHEAAADEPDLVKNDGKRIVTATDGVLRVLDVATRRYTATLALPGGRPTALLLDGDHVLVTAAGTDPTGYESRPFQPRTVIHQVDLNGGARITGTLEVDGDYLDGRQVGSVVRLVVRSWPRMDFVYPDMKLDVEGATKLNRTRVEQAPIEDWLPRYHLKQQDGQQKSGTLVDCAGISRPTDHTGSSLLTVLTVDLRAALGQGDAISIAADGDTVYGTGTSLYVADDKSSRYLTPMPVIPPTEEPGMSQPGSAPTKPPAPPVIKSPPITDSSPISVTQVPVPTATKRVPLSTPVPPPPPVPPGDDGTATPSDAERPNLVPLPDAPSFAPTLVPESPITSTAPIPTPAPQPFVQRTDIHQFDIGGPGKPTYLASGSVDGTLVNQYALSERNGNLRVATTIDNPTAGRSDSSVHVLTRRGSTLAQIGRVDGLGPGERIQSVRYVDDTAYVVTFRRTDPLYTVDLADPAHPRVVGALKITGFSAYLHPVAPGRLLGVGQEATKSGRTTGTQVSLFDITKPEAQRLAQIQVPGASSAVEYDAHAFLYWPERALVVVPYNDFDGSGAMLLHVTPDNLTTIGRVQPPMQTAVQRTLVAGDALWCVTERGVVVSGLDGAQPNWLPFA